MITTKTCSTCEHFPNDKHCVGCVWDEGKRENTKWELKKNPIMIECSVLDKIKAEIETDLSHFCFDDWGNENTTWKEVKAIIDKYRAEGSGEE